MYNNYLYLYMYFNCICAILNVVLLTANLFSITRSALFRNFRVEQISIEHNKTNFVVVLKVVRHMRTLYVHIHISIYTYS